MMQITKKKVILAAIVCAVVVLAMILSIVMVSQIKPPAFVPPEFDAAAVDGTPTDAGDSWSRIFQEGMNFSAHICGRIVPYDGKADLYFTNDAENAVLMKLRVYNEMGAIIAETGLIRPGQYIKTVTFTTVPKNGEKISMKIMTYQPDTYYSEGAVAVTTMIG